MAEATHFTIRIDNALKMKAKEKAQKEFGIGLGTLTKLFIKYFAGESGKSKIVFYLGDEEFDKKFNDIFKSKKVKNAIKELGKSI